MKLLFITDNFPPEVNAPARRTYEHCRHWVDQGVDVTVLTCAPNFPKGKVFPGYKNRWKQTEVLDGIRVIRVWSYMTNNAGFLKRSLDYFSFALTSYIAGLRLDPDIIVATSPQFFTTWSACLLSKSKRKPWVFELRDLWPESISAVGMMNNSFLIRMLEKIELALYRDASLIIPNTESFKKNLIKRGISAEKINVVHNGADFSLFLVNPVDQNLRSMLKLEDKFIIGYLGTHGLAHGLDFILDCASNIIEDNIHFLFVGDGAEKEELVRYASEKKMTNVTFLDSVPIHQVPDYLNLMDVSLVPLRKSDTFKTVIPSKIFEAGLSGVPVLLGVEGEAKQLVQTYDTGLCFEPENANDFTDKVYKLYNDSESYRRFSENGKAFARTFDRKVMASRMLNFLRAQISPALQSNLQKKEELLVEQKN